MAADNITKHYQAILENPRRVLIIDLVGASVTSLLTILLLASGLVPTGLPVWLLYSMALTAGGFACFDIAAYFIVPNTKIALAAIAMLNLAYCIGVIVICAVFFQSITLLALLYFAIEIPIILAVASWEFSTARNCATDESPGVS